MLTFVILALATYRLTHLIVYDKVFDPVRRLFVVRFMGEFNGKPHLCYSLQGGHVRRFIGSIMVCHWCSGIWVSAAVVGIHRLVPETTDTLFLILAIASVQSLLESGWSKSVGLPPEMVPKEDGPDESQP